MLRMWRRDCRKDMGLDLGCFWTLEADSSFCRILQKTTDYLEHFARFRRKENVEAVERLLTAQKQLAKFERAQLGWSYSFSGLGYARNIRAAY